jgi:hypothetical protein
MTDKERKYYRNKYRHINLHFGHYAGWDDLTLCAAFILDKKYWPKWMPNWLKRLNNYLLYARKGKSLVSITKFYHSSLRKVVPFIKEYPRFSQIKEKFGGLRLYATHSEPDIFRVLEGASYETCEYCGWPNWISNDNELGRTTGWIKTCCKKCAVETGKINSWKSLRDINNENN